MIGLGAWNSRFTALLRDSRWNSCADQWVKPLWVFALVPSASLAHVKDATRIIIRASGKMWCEKLAHGITCLPWWLQGAASCLVSSILTIFLILRVFLGVFLFSSLAFTRRLTTFSNFFHTCFLPSLFGGAFPCSCILSWPFCLSKEAGGVAGLLLRDGEVRKLVASA